MDLFFFFLKPVNAVREIQLNKQRMKTEALDVSWLDAITATVGGRTDRQVDTDL